MFNFPFVKLFNLFVGFNELNNIKGRIIIKINIKDNVPPIPNFFFLSYFFPTGKSSFSSSSVKASKIES